MGPEKVLELFLPYGGATSLKRVKSKWSKLERFRIVLKDPSRGNDAIKDLDGSEVFGRTIRLSRWRNIKKSGGAAASNSSSKKSKNSRNNSTGGNHQSGNYQNGGLQNANSNGQLEPAWYPPGAEAKNMRQRPQLFADEFDTSFHVPQRIANVPNELIAAVNDFHFAMMNDLPRNEFYRAALLDVVSEDTTIVEIGLGSGLLSLICAQLGAKHVTGIEASKPLARLAQRNIHTNGFADKISVINGMSTAVAPKHLKHGPVDILLSEILGTLLLSENALEFNEDAKRLMKPGGHVIPRLGMQFVTLIESEKLDLITGARKWRGLDFRNFNQLKDTASLLFTKELGCRLCTLDPTNMSERLPVIEVDFAKDHVGNIGNTKRIRTRALKDGIIHAAVFSWEVYSGLDKKHKMSTHYEDTVENFQRDMQWGQGIQLLEDPGLEDTKDAPCPLRVKKGEELVIEVRIAQEGAIMQCHVYRAATIDDHTDEKDDEEGMPQLEQAGKPSSGGEAEN
mmetsp:Transcript_12724/g.17771  ORF Transcript_12724/g.17771 Transcript_12724/m.17771 type:complete len:509 (-) Transcript_12724:129-1655(-)